MPVKKSILDVTKIIVFRFIPIALSGFFLIDLLSRYCEKLPVIETYAGLILLTFYAYILGEFVAKPIRILFEELRKE